MKLNICNNRRLRSAGVLLIVLLLAAIVFQGMAYAEDKSAGSPVQKQIPAPVVEKKDAGSAAESKPEQEKPEVIKVPPQPAGIQPGKIETVPVPPAPPEWNMTEGTKKENGPVREFIKSHKVPLLPLKEKGFYLIYWGDVLFGISAYHVEKRLTLLDETFTQVRSFSTLKVGFEKVSEQNFETKTVIKDKSGFPETFVCLQGDTAAQGNLEALFSDNFVAQKVALGDEGRSYYIPLTGPALVYADNLWGRINLFVEQYRLILEYAGKTGGYVEVYDPILRSTGSVYVDFKGVEKAEIAGKSYSARKFEFIDPFREHTFIILQDGKSGQILSIKQQNGPLKIEIASPKKTEELFKSPGLDLWAMRVIQSSIYFTSPEKVDSLTVKINLDATDLSFLNHHVIGFKQEFTGESSGMHAAGTVSIKASKVKIESGGKYPMPEVSEEIRQYLVPLMGIESDDPIVKNRALEMTWGKDDTWAIAKGTCEWVHDNIKEGISLPSAKLTMESLMGGSEARSLLFIALCRASGLPARKVQGLIFATGRIIPHIWAEVYLEKHGWVPMDPSTGEYGGLSAVHVSLGQNGELVSQKEFNVTAFSPTPEESVSYIVREMVWPVGEERVYRLMRDGEFAGQEKSHLATMGFYDDKESYTMYSSITGEEGDPRILLSRTQFDSEGLPLEFIMERGLVKEFPVKEAGAGVENAGTQGTPVEAGSAAVGSGSGAEAGAAPKFSGSGTEAEAAAGFAVSAGVTGDIEKGILKEDKYFSSIVNIQPISKYIFEKNVIKAQFSSGINPWDIPCSNGTYIADGRVFGHWALAVEQAKLTKPGMTAELTLFDSQSLSFETITLNTGQLQEITINDKPQKAYPVTSSDGKLFYTDENGRVVKMLWDKAGLQVDLIEVNFKY